MNVLGIFSLDNIKTRLIGYKNHMNLSMKADL